MYLVSDLVDSRVTPCVVRVTNSDSRGGIFHTNYKKSVSFYNIYIYM